MFHNLSSRFFIPCCFHQVIQGEHLHNFSMFINILCCADVNERVLGPPLGKHFYYPLLFHSMNPIAYQTGLNLRKVDDPLPTDSGPDVIPSAAMQGSKSGNASRASATHAHFAGEDNSRPNLFIFSSISEILPKTQPSRIYLRCARQKHSVVGEVSLPEE